MAGKEIILAIIFLGFLSILFSLGYKKDLGLMFAQSVKISSEETRITIPCYTYQECYNILSQYYTQEEIKKLDLKCENSVCTIKGYIDTMVVRK